MYYRKLGATGCLVGEIGIDAWALGLAGGTAHDDATAVAMIRTALLRGANFLDSGPLSPDSRAERLLSQALDGRREQALVATRAGLAHDSAGRATSDLSAAAIESAARESVARLGCGYIDLFQLDHPAQHDLENEALWEALDRLKSDGVISHVGAVAATVESAAAAIAGGRVATVQITLNAAEPALLPVLAQAAAAGVGIIARAPLAGGLLAGRAAAPSGAARADGAAPDGFAAEMAALLAALASESERTAAQAALGWVLTHEAVSVTVPDARSLPQLEENLAASNLPLPSPRHLAAIQHLQLTGRPMAGAPT